MASEPVPGDGSPYLSVVVPAYNEEKRLPASLEKILAYLDAQPFSWEVVVVDDGSADRTSHVVEQLAAKRPGVTLVRVPHRGKGYAVRTGMLQARGQNILFTDADLSTPIEKVSTLLRRLEDGYDVAVGSREGLGARRIGEPFYRHAMGRVFNWCVKLLAVRSFRDTQCGFKCFRREAAHDLFSRVKLYGADAETIQKGPMVTGFDVEVLFLGQKRGYRMVEVPVEWKHYEGSKVSPFKDSVRMFRDVIRVRLNAWRGEYDSK